MTSSAIELFSEACGLTGPLRLDILGEDASPRTRPSFDQPFLVIGRGPRTDLVLDQDKVSTPHCYLQVIGGRVVAVDLGSPSGIVIGGVPGRVGWIDRVQPLRVGSVELRLRGGDRADGPGVDPRKPAPSLPLTVEYAREHPLPATTLEIVGRKGVAYRCRITRALTLVGRADGCRLRLVDPRVSDYHCALVRTPSGVWLVDLLSCEGIRVSGSRVRVVRLDEGVVCGLGPFTVRLDPDAPVVDPEPGHTMSTVVSPGLGASDFEEPSGRGVDLPSHPTGQILGQQGGVAADALWTQGDPVVAGRGQVRDVVMMLAQMLGAMHRDHMELVRDQLTEIRRLAEEMHALRTDIHRPPASAPVAPRPIGAGDGFEVTPNDIHRVGGSPATDGDPVGIDPPVRRDPRECLEIASGFLAACEREQHGYWTKILRLVTRLSGDPTWAPIRPEGRSDRPRSPDRAACLSSSPAGRGELG